MKSKGTRITYLGGTSNPAKDNRDAIKNLKPLTDEEYKDSFKDPLGAFIYVTDEKVFGICKLKYKTFPFLLIEPNPVTFYYSVAFDVVKQFEECHQKLSAIIRQDIYAVKKGRELAVAYSYFFKVTSIGIIFSYLALEAFLNQQLPDNKKIIYKGKEVSKEKIERYFSFTEKLDVVIPDLNYKNFAVVHPAKREIINKLLALRHELTHLKQKRGSGLTQYEQLYQKVLLCDLRKIVSTVKSLLNFYSPKLIINYKYNSPHK